MLRRILLIFILAQAGLAKAQETSLFRNISLTEAVTASANEHKNIMLMCYEDWCSHCEKMLDEVFTDTTVINYYEKNYICLKQDMSEDIGPQLRKRFYVTSFPTFVFLDQNNETIYQVVGEHTSADLIKVGKDALVEQNQLPYLAKRFENDPADSVSCYKYLQAMSRGRLPSQKIADRYFQLHKNDLEFSLANWKIFNISVSDMESEVFQYMVEHRDEFSAVVTYARVDRKLYKTAAYNLQTAATPNDTTAYSRQKKLAAKLHMFSVDSIIFVSDINIYERNKNFTAFSSTALAGTEKYIWNDYAQLRHISDIFLNFINDNSALEKAAGFAQRSAEIKPEYGNTLLSAKLYLKSGNKTKAREEAEAAKAIAVKLQTNSNEADLIIGQCN